MAAVYTRDYYPECKPGVSPPPEFLPIELDISFVFISGTNISDSAMVACCQPYPISVIDNCYEWCKLPPQYTNTSDALKHASVNFLHCLTEHGSHPRFGATIHPGISASSKIHLSMFGVAVITLVISSIMI